MSKLIPKYQSPWLPLNYKPPENSEPKSSKPKTALISKQTDIDLAYNTNPLTIAFRNRREIEQNDKPLSGTDPVGEFYVTGEALGPLFKGLGLVGKLLLPYTARLLPKGGLRNLVTAKSLSNTMNSDALTGGVNRVVDKNGNILLQLNRHSDRNPRQLRIEPQGNNKFRVHASTWGGVTNDEKQLLYEALYNELPEGGQILFPESRPDYLATRGTVAALRRLGRDKRFIKGSTQLTLLFQDKNGINTFTGTSFTKGPENLNFFHWRLHSPTNSEVPLTGGYSKSTDVSLGNNNFENLIQGLRQQYNGMIGEEVNAMPNSTIDMFSEQVGFTPRYYVKPGQVNSDYMTKEYLTRLREAGYHIFDPIPMKERGFTLVKSPNNFIMNNNRKSSIIGSFKDKNLGGIYSRNYDVSAVSPETRMKFPSILFHERNMHGTDPVIDALDAWKPYSDFLEKLYYDEAVVDGVTYRFPNNIEGLGLLPESANKEELRATVGELIRLIHAEIGHNNGYKLKPENLSNIRLLVNNYIDNLSNKDLINKLNTVNGYGLDYVKLSKNNPDFIKDLKNLIKTGYSITLLNKMSNNEENND